MIGDVSRAEEVTNDVMIEVWKSAGRFEARSRPSTWIIGITRHLCLNAMRGKRYDMVDIDDTPVASNDTPEAARSQEDDQRLLRQAVAKLSPEHREVVELTFYQGLSYKEIAEIAGCPENTVKTRMFHAKKQLKARLTRLAQGSALGIGGTA
jgi:RNA polymerase sigma-70 factor (ECF subfamily)